MLPVSQLGAVVRAETPGEDLQAPVPGVSGLLLVPHPGERIPTAGPLVDAPAEHGLPTGGEVSSHQRIRVPGGAAS